MFFILDAIMYVLVLFVAVASAGGVGGGPYPKGLKVFDAVSVGLMLFSELMILKFLRMCAPLGNAE